MTTTKYVLPALPALLLVACSGPLSPSGAGSARAQVTTRSASFGECANEVAAVSFTPQSRQASFTTEFVSPGSFRHQFRVISLDLTGFPGGGNLTISGKLGTGAAQGSFALLPTSPDYVCSGFLAGQLAASSNIQPGQSFSLSHRFSTGSVLRFVAEGSWDAAKDAKNTVELSFRVD